MVETDGDQNASVVHFGNATGDDFVRKRTKNNAAKFDFGGQVTVSHGDVAIVDFEFGSRVV